MTVINRHIYKAEAAAMLLIQPLDSMTAIYHRRSGITHIVAEPVPQILQVMGDTALTTGEIVQRLGSAFDLDHIDAESLIAERLEEMAALGFLERARA